MQLHELIDREDPKCLYCRVRCDLKVTGRNSSVAQPDPYTIEILTCTNIKCQEIFEIHSWDDDQRVSDFVFTCKDIVVINKYPQPSGTAVGFNIGDKSNLWPKMFSGHITTNIPPFKIDFSNKNKLYNKLKTYLVFS